MRIWLLTILLLLSGCLTAGRDVMPETWPEDPAIHPGMRLYASYGGHYSQCTAGFMFASPDNATLYLSLSAHCLHSEGTIKLGDPIYGAVPNGLRRPIGTVVFDGWQKGDETIVRDFALVALSNREGVRDNASPAVEHWGGPLGVANSQLAIPGTRVAAYGNSMGRADPAGNPSLGRIVETLQGDVQVKLDRDAIQGDSGGPVLTWDGRALGILSHERTLGDLLGDTQTQLFTPLDVAIRMVRQEGSADVRDVRLVTWGDWRGPGLPL